MYFLIPLYIVRPGILETTCVMFDTVGTGVTKFRFRLSKDFIAARPFVENIRKITGSIAIGTYIMAMVNIRSSAYSICICGSLCMVDP